MTPARPVISLLLRCMPSPSHGLAGQAEVVDTGEVVTIRSVDDLVATVERLVVERRHGPA